MSYFGNIACMLAIGTSAALFGAGCMSPIEDEEHPDATMIEEQATATESLEIGEANQAWCGNGGFYGGHGGYWGGYGGYGHGGCGGYGGHGGYWGGYGGYGHGGCGYGGYGGFGGYGHGGCGGYR